MSCLIGCSQERQRLGEMARARAREFFNWERVTDEYESLFRKIVQGPKSKVQG
jgi:glycosyltransferase involved in cell wall biosynthesis